VSQQEVMSSLFLSFGLEYSIRKVQENQQRLELNGTHQLLDCADDIHLLNRNINTVEWKHTLY